MVLHILMASLLKYVKKVQGRITQGKLGKGKNEPCKES